MRLTNQWKDRQRFHGLGQLRAGRTRNQAFTLIELLAVVLVIAVLVAATLGVASYVGTRAKIAQTKALLAQLELGIEAFKGENGYYPTSTIYRLSYHPYLVQTNSWLLYEQLKKYIHIKSDYITRGAYSGHTNISSGVAHIIDAWQNPIIYYNPITNVAYNSYANSYTYLLVSDTDYFTVGGKVNSATYDLFSYGPDKATFVPGAPSPWGLSSAADDIANFKP